MELSIFLFFFLRRKQRTRRRLSATCAMIQAQLQGTIVRPSLSLTSSSHGHVDPFVTATPILLWNFNLSPAIQTHLSNSLRSGVIPGRQGPKDTRSAVHHQNCTPSRCCAAAILLSSFRRPINTPFNMTLCVYPNLLLCGWDDRKDLMLFPRRL
ncbi:hypothetical protein B0H12DRAFT_587091 [Mycena haematopus]|nr:hypothetical protein B0H12DRAFT_587091 [Mycena haematopus]